MMKNDEKMMEQLLRESAEEENLDFNLVKKILDKEKDKAMLLKRRGIFDELRAIIRNYVKDHLTELEEDFGAEK